MIEESQVVGHEGDLPDALADLLRPIVVNPPRSNRKLLRDYDRHCYKARYLIENLFARLKQFRRLATRYDKLAVHSAETPPIARA